MTEYEQIAENIASAEQLITVKYDENYSIQEVKMQFGERKSKLIELSCQTSQLLEQWVVPFLDNAELITDEVYENLFNFATRICSHSVRSDCMLAFKIHSVLYDIAKKKNDLEKIITEIYYKGLVLNYADGQFFVPKTLSIMYEIEDYLPHYNSLTLKAKDFANRILGNIVMVGVTIDGDGIEEIISFAQKHIAFWEGEKAKGKTDLPYDNYIFATYRNLTMSLQFIRINKHCTPLVLNTVVDAATYVFEHISTIYKITSLPLLHTCKYAYYASLWHAGRISGEKLLEELKNLVGESQSDPYSSDSLWRALRMKVYYMVYAEMVRGTGTEEYEKEAEQIIKEIKDYLKGCEKSKLQSEVDYEIMTCVSSMHTRLDSNDDMKKLPYYSLLVNFDYYYKNKVVYELGMMVISQLFEDNSPLVSKYDYNELKKFFYLCVNTATIGFQYYKKTIHRCYRDPFDEETQALALQKKRGALLLASNKISEIYIEACRHYTDNYKDRLTLDARLNLAIDLQKIMSHIFDKAVEFAPTPNKSITVKECLASMATERDLQIDESLLSLIINNDRIVNLLQFLARDIADKMLFESYKSYFEERDAVIMSSIN